jgi:hypothetical protein
MRINMKMKPPIVSVNILALSLYEKHCSVSAKDAFVKAPMTLKEWRAAIRASHPGHVIYHENQVNANMLAYATWQLAATIMQEAEALRERPDGLRNRVLRLLTKGRLRLNLARLNSPQPKFVGPRRAFAEGCAFAKAALKFL